MRTRRHGPHPCSPRACWKRLAVQNKAFPHRPKVEYYPLQSCRTAKPYSQATPEISQHQALQYKCLCMRCCSACSPGARQPPGKECAQKLPLDNHT